MYARILTLVIFCLSASPFLAYAQTDSIKVEKPWLVPNAAVVQHAGNMGYVAIGPSYDLFRKKVAADILYGYVPRFQAKEALHLLTLRFTYQPYEIKLSESYSITPLRVGMAGSYYLNDQFSLNWGRDYPRGYYWWPEAIRVLGFAGAAINCKFDPNKSIKELSFYSELGTYDLIVTSWFRDRSIKFYDILSVSVGVRASFF